MKKINDLQTINTELPKFTSRDFFLQRKTHKKNFAQDET